MLVKLRENWPAAVLFTAGIVLRVLAVVSYRPALFYIDTVRYLYDSGGNDPVGYRLPLRAILAIGNFDLLAIVQHLLGLAMAVTIYLVLVRRTAGGSGGSSPRASTVQRWLAALAIAPVLLDAYQIQMEQLVLPDVWFEALIVAGIAVLLAGTQSARPPALKAVIAGGLIFGLSATFRQVGEILILPALFYLLMVSGGWRTLLTRAAALLVAFVVPILAYMTGSYLLVGHFYLSHSGVTTTYGRMASAADCATLRLPPIERGLCPTRAQQALGPDWLEHDPHSPIKPYYTGPLSAQASHLVARFNNAVLTQQPTRVLGSYVADVGKVFALSKVATPGDTPVWRWQFQTHYPFRAPHATLAQVQSAITKFGGGNPAVWHPGATALRDYQLGGGYTPGPLLALCGLAGLAGSTAAVIARYRELRPRRRTPAAHNQPAPATPRPTHASTGAEFLAAPTPAIDHPGPTETGTSTAASTESSTGDSRPTSTTSARADRTGQAASHSSSGGGATDIATETRTNTPAPIEASTDHPHPTAATSAHTDRNAAPANHSPDADAARDPQTTPTTCADNGRADRSSGGDEAGGTDAGTRWRELALECLLFFGCAAAVLLMSDVFEFSWRYQLPALVTLPPAAAAVVAGITRRRATGPAARATE
jgi:hypothetical protein